MSSYYLNSLFSYDGAVKLVLGNEISVCRQRCLRDESAAAAAVVGVAAATSDIVERIGGARLPKVNA